MKKSVWVSELDLYPISNIGRRVRVEADTQSEAQEAMSDWMTANGMCVGRTCYAPMIREEIRVTVSGDYTTP